MTSDLAPFTRELEECRKRWNRRTLNFVLEMAAILTRARNAAKEERCWNVWIREETHMNPSTAYRYMRAAKFVQANVSLRKCFDRLSINKIYALSRLTASQAASMIRHGRAAEMSDAALYKQVRLLIPRKKGRPTVPNLVRSFTAAVNRVERVMYRWQSSHRAMPAPVHARMLSRLRTLTQAIGQLKQDKPLAM